MMDLIEDARTASLTKEWAIKTLISTTSSAILPEAFGPADCSLQYYLGIDKKTDEGVAILAYEITDPVKKEFASRYLKSKFAQQAWALSEEVTLDIPDNQPRIALAVTARTEEQEKAARALFEFMERNSQP